MRQVLAELVVETRGRGLYDITARLAEWLAGHAIGDGLLTVFVRHTSASLTVQENADPDVLRDLEDFFARLVIDGDARYRHRLEGPDDMAAHIRSALTLTQLAVPVVGGRLALGTWQAIYLWEHRTAPHRRRLALHLAGE